MGATTVWERWDSMLPDGTINPGEMTSFNHYALGAVADWMHRTIGGIAPLEPGYGTGPARAAARRRPRPGRRRRSRPRTGGSAVQWSLAEGVLTVDTTLPPGVSGVLSLPDGREVEVGPGEATHAG